jgi:hypothetical protein
MFEEQLARAGLPYKKSKENVALMLPSGKFHREASRYD